MSLYNKYRPKRFERLIGHRPSTACIKLQNWMALESLPHALLLHGDTGCGKTTVARILAATLNCRDCPMGEPKNEPCGVCLGCQDVFEREDYDLVDAAVDTGIDAMREIVRRIALRPLTKLYRIVIFDEAHQLSRAAQNCLLTTMETPPDFVYILLCTTDPKKLIPTLRNRCVELRFNQPRNDEVLQLLSWISFEEGDERQPEDLEKQVGAFTSVRDAINRLEIVLAGGEPGEDEEDEKDPARALSAIMASGKPIRSRGQIETVAGILRGLRRVPNARATVVEYLHSVLLGKLNSGRVSDIERLATQIKILTRHQDNALPALFTVDVREALLENHDPQDH